MTVPERNRNESARDYALRVLQQSIITMELMPGSLVSENELAAQLSLSRTPVREALMDLAKSRIVEILPQRGSRIALIDYDRVEEARFTREVVETAILPQICEEATPVQLEQLRQNLRMQRLTQEPQMEGAVDLVSLDDAFHRMLFSIAKKEYTYDLLRTMMIHFDRVRMLAARVVHDGKIIDDHQRILEAIAVRDAAAAQEVMRHHLRRVRLDEETLRAEFPQYIRPSKP